MIVDHITFPFNVSDKDVKDTLTNGSVTFEGKIPEGSILQCEEITMLAEYYQNNISFKELKIENINHDLSGQCADGRYMLYVGMRGKLFFTKEYVPQLSFLGTTACFRSNFYCILNGGFYFDDACDITCNTLILK